MSPPTAAAPDPAPGRIVAIDHIKALAIVAVAFTHAGAAYWDPTRTLWDRFLAGVWVEFHVPSFLLISGFLYQTSTPLDLRRVASRLSRVLAPYLVASALVQIVGLSQAKDAGEVIFQLLTGSSLGVYYYIFLLALCIPTLWPLSRLTPRQTWAVFGVVLVTTLGAETYVHLLTEKERAADLGGLFWAMRNPFNFSYTYFLLGWLAALYRRPLTGWIAAHPRALLGSCAAGIGLWVATHVWDGIAFTGGSLRLLYSLSVVGSLTLLFGRARLRPLIRFLSESTLTLYLYHHIFQLLLAPRIGEWHPGLRIVLLVVGGMLGAACVAGLGRRVLGARARVWVGA